MPFWILIYASAGLMMSLFVLRTRSDVRKTGADEYQATTDDPRFTYRFWARRPRFMVVFLEFLEVIPGPIVPNIYIDRGSGFHAGDTVTLWRPRGCCIYSIRVTAPHQVSRLRLDPCSAPMRFRYWAKCAWSEAGRDRLLADAERCGRGKASIEEITIDGAPELRTAVQEELKRIDDHFASVVGLAKRAAPPIDVGMMKNAPFISFVVPVYNAIERYLDDLLASFCDQPAGSAELILCDDASTSAQTLSWLSQHEHIANVRIVRGMENRGIALATNSGIAVARGEWISFIDHDDALTPCAVLLIAQAARDHPRCQFIYTDELVTDETLKPVAYFLKPAYDEVLLSGVNYINHLSCYRRERLLALGGLRAGYDGSQDYDLLLRYLRDLKADEIKHLPFPAYRWRRTASVYSAQFTEKAIRNARKALAERYRHGTAEPAIDEAIAQTLYRVRLDELMTHWPRVSIVIPNRNAFPFISRLLADLAERTSYPDFEIIVVDNGTTDPRVLDLYAKSKAGAVPFRYDIEAAPFNFSRQVNRGVALASGELILLLNNDIEVIESHWLREMVSCFSYPDTGIVGARLLYSDERLQHAGVIVGLGGLAGHWFIGQHKSFPGPMARLHVRQSLTAVTGACMLISRACLETVGNFDEGEFAVAYSDTDFCLRAVAEHFRVVWTPFATLIHHESATRGSDMNPANRDRYEREKENLRRRHGTDAFEDRAFSPWYTRNRAAPATLLLDKLPKAR